MDNSFHTFTIPDVKEVLASVGETGVGDDDLFMCDVGGDSPDKGREMLKILKAPLRFDGYVGFVCLDGEITVDINLRTCKVRGNTMLINVPGTIFRVGDVSGDALRFVVVWISRRFMGGIRFDFNKLFCESEFLLDNPCITLNESQFALARGYFHLTSDLLGSDLTDRKDALRSLVSSVLYVLGSAWKQNMQELKASGKIPLPGRSKLIFDRFLSLVTEYHDTERNMSFYADRLCLTPKYLSKLIRQASGRSAPEWIDSFVILEAKNMLRYSDVPIKEIVYKLHFPNQSVFYKFFKSHTGMTPSEYRKG